MRSRTPATRRQDERRARRSRLGAHHVRVQRRSRRLLPLPGARRPWPSCGNETRCVFSWLAPGLVASRGVRGGLGVVGRVRGVRACVCHPTLSCPQRGRGHERGVACDVALIMFESNTAAGAVLDPRPCGAFAGLRPDARRKNVWLCLGWLPAFSRGLGVVGSWGSWWRTWGGARRRATMLIWERRIVSSVRSVGMEAPLQNP